MKRRRAEASRALGRRGHSPDDAARDEAGESPADSLPADSTSASASELSDRRLEEWCRKALAGDGRARCALLDASAAIARGVVASIVGDDDGDEVVHDTVLRVHDRLETIAHPDRFRSWLAAIALNVARDHLRAKRRDQRERVDSEVIERSGDRTTDPVVRLALKEMIEQLDARIEQMPSASRPVFRLIVDEGLGVAEIGARLRLTESAVWSRMRRGREYLRAHGWGEGES